MKLRVLTGFNGVKEQKKFCENEIIDVTNERAFELLNTTYLNKPIVEIAEITNKNNNQPRIMIYQITVYEIGGIETWIYNLTKYYKDKNITLVYKEGDYKQLLRMSKYCNVVKDTGQQFECDICILSSYNGNKVLDRVKSKKIYQMIHADYKELDKKFHIKYTHDKRVDKIICVSKTAQKSLKEMYGLDSDVIYNIPDYDYKDEKVLKLITMSRATQEKGIDRIIKMARMLKANNRKFIWYLCITTEQTKKSILNEINGIEEFVVIKPNVDNKWLIKECDYLVQLSDTESYCYAVAESLQRKVPVIVTNYPAAYELVKDGVNGYILDMGLSNLDIDKVYNQIPVVKEYKDLCDTSKWDKLLV